MKKLFIITSLLSLGLSEGYAANPRSIKVERDFSNKKASNEDSLLTKTIKEFSQKNKPLIDEVKQETDESNTICQAQGQDSPSCISHHYKVIALMKELFHRVSEALKHVEAQMGGK